ncbi:TPA: hypothetical protein DIC20_00025 [Candidatus Dependentiae bacterium]|nr:hypothetical protein [Candidatus Dependentiae bacterium]
MSIFSFFIMVVGMLTLSATLVDWQSVALFLKKRIFVLKKIFIFYLISGFISVTKSEEIDLRNYEIRRISQNGEDGVLEKIFQLIGTTNKYYVEFGAGDGNAGSNVKWLREKYEWRGLLLDGACYSSLNTLTDSSDINLHKEFVTAENICELFEKYGVPQEFDLISIDIDGNDFYVWRALNKKYKPRVVVIEYNPNFNFIEDKVTKYNPEANWDYSAYFGASILALFKLGRTLGYSLIYAESTGNNLFFVHDDILKKSKVKFKDMNNIAKIYKPVLQDVVINLPARNSVYKEEYCKILLQWIEDIEKKYNICFQRHGLIIKKFLNFQTVVENFISSEDVLG